MVLFYLFKEGGVEKLVDNRRLLKVFAYSKGAVSARRVISDQRRGIA